MKALFDRYVGRTIGLNYASAYAIDAANLVESGADYFAAVGEKDGVTHYYPHTSVLHAMEKEGGVEVGGLFRHRQAWPLVVKVGHIVDIGPVV